MPSRQAQSTYPLAGHGDGNVTIRVVLCDDEGIVLEGLAMLLESAPDMEVVAKLKSGIDAVRVTLDLLPDVVVMDVRMPVVDGIEATRRIVAGLPPAAHVQILMLTTFGAEEAIYSALRAGASGYLLKYGAPGQLIAAVRSVAAGEGWLDPAITRSLIKEFAARPDPPPLDELRVLTPKELEVMVLLGHGLSNAEIAARLFVEVGTVKSHVGHILLKLGLHDRGQAMIVAYRCGLVRPGESLPPTRKSR